MSPPNPCPAENFPTAISMFPFGYQSRPRQHAMLGTLVKVLCVLLMLSHASQAIAEGQWVQVVNMPPTSVTDMHLLSDGTVMARSVLKKDDPYANIWYRLTPDGNGHYVQGTWAVISQSICPHAEFASQMLRDGRLFVAGGEYGAGDLGLPPNSKCSPVTGAESGGRSDAEIYDPVQDQWQNVQPALCSYPLTQPSACMSPTVSTPCGGIQSFYDMVSETLPSGAVLMAPVAPPTSGATFIYDPVANQWTYAGKLQHGCNMSEATWVRLTDGSILAVDSQATSSERYVGSSWVSDAPVSDGTVPIMLYSGQYANGGEEGPAFVLPNGNAIFIGATHFYAVYQPGPGGSAQGTWAIGKLILTTSGPGSTPIPLGAPDAPGANMMNGKVLLTLSAEPSAANPKPSPQFFYEYDQGSNSFTQIHAPDGTWSDCGTTDGSYMLDLPDGSILYHPSCNSDATLYVYQPDGTPLLQAQPQIGGISKNADGSYHLTGTRLNGIWEGTSFGDDAQMATSYPLVRFTNASGVFQCNGAQVQLCYARSYNWSTTSIAPGASGTTEFVLPKGIEPGTYSVQVVANGIASSPVSLTVGNCPYPNETWNGSANICEPVQGCPTDCRYGCIYTPPRVGQPPVLVCRPAPS
jgi:hypothetical protein